MAAVARPKAPATALSSAAPSSGRSGEFDRRWRRRPQQSVRAINGQFVPPGDQLRADSAKTAGRLSLSTILHRAELRAGAFHPGQTPGSGDFLLAQNHGRRRERLQTTARSPPMAPRRGSCGHSMPIVPAAGGAFSPTRFSLTGAAFSLTGAAFGFGGHPRRFLRRAAKRKTHYVIMPKICEKGDNMLLRRIRRCIRI